MRATVIVFGVLLTLSPSSLAVATVDVRITPEGFVPNEVEVQVGDTVRFTNEDAEPHWVASDDHPTHTVYPGSDVRKCGENSLDIYDSCEGLVEGEAYEFTFTQAGVWGLHDHLNPTLLGTIVVHGKSIPIEVTSVKLSSLGIARAWLREKWYGTFKDAGARKLDELNLVVVTRNDRDLEYWMRVFGYRAIFDELQKDANDPASRPSTAGAQEAVGQCHIEAHYAGRMAARLNGLETVTENLLDTRCQFGFYHGMIEITLGTIGNDEVLLDFTKQCEEYADDPLRRSFCAHALGHGITVMSKFDLPYAIKKCGELPLSAAGKRMCYHGAFMENAFAKWGVGVSGHTTTWIDEQRPDFPCDSKAYPDDPAAVQMCYGTQSLIWGRRVGGFDARGAIEGCLRAPATARDWCFTGLGFNMSFAMGNETLNDAQIVERCESAPRPLDRKNCLLGAMFMRTTHWWTFSGFKNETFCTALKQNDLDECDAYVWSMFSWMRD